MERILLLEDDKSLVTGLALALGRAGYALDTARTLVEANRLWQAGRHDLLMLDVTLPDGTGFDFCREVRRTSGVPILFLTASDEEMDIITGLDLGGDDYITKPFKLGVLLSRVHALLRRRVRGTAGHRAVLRRHPGRSAGRPGRKERRSAGTHGSGVQVAVPVSAQPGAGADQRDHSERPVGLRGQLCRYQHPHGVHPAAAAQGRGRPRQPAAAGHGAGHGLPLERGCVR